MLKSVEFFIWKLDSEIVKFLNFFVKYFARLYIVFSGLCILGKQNAVSEWLGSKFVAFVSTVPTVPISFLALESEKNLYLHVIHHLCRQSFNFHNFTKSWALLGNFRMTSRCKVSLVILTCFIIFSIIILNGIWWLEISFTFNKIWVF